ncbi:AUGMIN subunit 4 isoform X3 [Pyrus x bretschneideri]|uniref:AUGMIN subunit 4 isoform X3 n=1 Tax=Pyrus x bretschneideri TaxID=225117 RepID=UPI00202F1DE8|nr:AUGMIN subunit 4 isoform X3 [Pyrus x bretschneideri]
MAKGLQQLQGQNLPPDVAHVVDQLERHCLAPDGSLGSKSAYYDLQLAREEMCRERVRYLEAMAIYGEAIAMVEEYQQGLKHSSEAEDMKEYQLCLSREIEARLEEKCDKLADALVIDNIDSSPLHETSSSQLPERFGLLSLSRVKLITEEIEREEEALQEDLYSADRKFSEYYNVLEQILGVLVKLIKDLKLHHQHNYDELQKTWLCKRCVTMSAKLRKLEYAIVGQTYTKESVPALRKIRKHLTDATEEASVTYNKAVTRLHEYQGVDPHFDQIARQYRDIVKKLENMNWTIHQVEMDLKRLPDHPNA